MDVGGLMLKNFACNQFIGWCLCKLDDSSIWFDAINVFLMGDKIYPTSKYDDKAV